MTFGISTCNVWIQEIGQDIPGVAISISVQAVPVKFVPCSLTRAAETIQVGIGLEKVSEL